MIVRVLPEVAGKISEPLGKTEKMVIINSGNGPGGGASKLTGDVTTIISQLPPVLESLTGVKFEKLLEQVPALKKAMSKGDDKGNKMLIRRSRREEALRSSWLRVPEEWSLVTSAATKLESLPIVDRK